MSEHTTTMIQIIQACDYEDLVQFFEENNKSEITRHFHPFPLTQKTVFDIVYINHLDRYYIAIRNEHIVGFCMLRGWEEGYEIPSFGAFVDYKYHGQGIGRALTEFAIAEAVRLGCPKVRLSVYASNVRALSLYRSLGFEEVSRKPCILDGVEDETIVMLKNLQD